MATMSKLGGTCGSTNVVSNMFDQMSDITYGRLLLTHGPLGCGLASGSTDCRQSNPAVEACIAVEAEPCYKGVLHIAHLWWAGRLGDGDPGCKCGL